jgi:hypothetical protein
MEVCSSVNDMCENQISKLESALCESLHIQDTEKSELLSEGNETCNVAEENLCGVIKQKESKPNTTCLKKSATFPIPHVMLPSSSSDEDADSSATGSPSEHSAHQTYSRSISLPVSFFILFFIFIFYNVSVNNVYMYMIGNYYVFLNA